MNFDAKVSFSASWNSFLAQTFTARGWFTPKLVVAIDGLQ
jgi:hypothetical protein